MENRFHGTSWTKGICAEVLDMLEHSFPLTFRHSHIQSWLVVKQKQMKVLCHLKAAKIFPLKTKTKQKEKEQTF